MKEIEAIDDQYALERKGRAEKLLQEWNTAIDKEMVKMRGYTFQLVEILHIHTTEQEDTILKNMAVELQSQLDRLKSEGKPIREARKKLEDLAKQTASRVAQP